MADLPNVPGVLKTVLKWANTNTGDAIVRFFTSYTGLPPVVADLVTLAGTLAEAWDTDGAPVQNPQWGLEDVTITDLTSPTSAEGSYDGALIPGTYEGDQLPAGAAFLVNFEVPRRYRGGHPRNYLPIGNATDLLNDQTWETATAEGYLGIWTDIVNVIPDNPWAGAGVLEPVNVSYYKGFTVVTNPITERARNVPTLRADPVVDVIDAMTYNPKVCYQRRRGGKR